MNVKDIYGLFQKTEGIVTDTRLCVENSFFIALKGINFDGNNFAKEAIKKGAKYALVNRKSISKDSDRFIYVDDTLKTLQRLANYHRSIIKTKIIAITGSNGKTTTKELLNEILSKEYKIFATRGNLNNHIGVPLSILNIDKESDYAIIELGANHLGEITCLCEIAEPDFGLITNFGHAHIEGFGSFEGVIKGKSELYDYIMGKKGRIFINVDDSIQEKWLKYNAISTYGKTSKADYKIDQINKRGKPISIKIENLIIESQLFGDYNYSNVGASVAISKFLGVSNQKIKKGIESYIPANNRSQVIIKKNNTIVLDAYNANPSSMIASINSFLKNNPKNSIAVLGDMLELGRYEEEGHMEIIRLIENSSFEEIFFVGKLFYKFSKKLNNLGGKIHFFKKKIEAHNYIEKRGFENKNILIKGSRKVQLESVTSFFNSF
ncbi:MAG: UDP-N-acetylmuramoyl-tripeptide--D-alanyl-D-alanine ligase [Flavobacteriaceae bacterium]|nr:UDP-N-acetylmuramoyl-tripeptide--D-alanyl-D-alanine ligase [Flavobacteriaceae bacterium]